MDVIGGMGAMKVSMVPRRFSRVLVSGAAVSASSGECSASCDEVVRKWWGYLWLCESQLKVLA